MKQSIIFGIGVLVGGITYDVIQKIRVRIAVKKARKLFADSFQKAFGEVAE